MAGIGGFDCRVEWLDAPDVSTPELAATWARYEIWTDDRCITQVESDTGSLRRSVYGSLYPMAEWVVANWWLLTTNVRPSSIPQSYWTWPSVREQSWLRHHNLRAAGDGMTSPDLTIVREGPTTSVRWQADRDRLLGPVRFIATGSAYANSDEVAAGLANVVDLVVERLAEEGLHKTRLAQDWAALAQLDHDEKQFCEIAARLGLDPFDVADELAQEIADAAAATPADLVAEFFDNADPASVMLAARWVRRATEVAGRAATRSETGLDDLQRTAASLAPDIASSNRPWAVGYRMARRVRGTLGVPDAVAIDVSRWVSVGMVRQNPGGLQGLAVVERDRCGLVLGRSSGGERAANFSRARALGRTLARPGRKRYLLSAAGGPDEQLARSFAAELLAPAAGIRAALDSIGQHDEIAFEEVASRFRVSPMVIRHQYDNQLARTQEGADQLRP